MKQSVCSLAGQCCVTTVLLYCVVNSAVSSVEGSGGLPADTLRWGGQSGSAGDATAAVPLSGRVNIVKYYDT